MKLTISTARVIPAGTRKTSMKKARPKILANSNSSGILGMHNLTVILLEKQEEIHKTYNAQDRSGARPAPLAWLSYAGKTISEPRAAYCVPWPYGHLVRNALDRGLGEGNDFLQEHARQETHSDQEQSA